MRKKTAMIDAKTRCYGAWASIAEKWNEGKFEFPLPVHCWTATAPGNGGTGYGGRERDEEVVFYDEDDDVDRISS